MRFKLLVLTLFLAVSFSGFSQSKAQIKLKKYSVEAAKALELDDATSEKFIELMMANGDAVSAIAREARKNGEKPNKEAMNAKKKEGFAKVAELLGKQKYKELRKFSKEFNKANKK